MILKGQNFRILTRNGAKYSVIAKSTSCTVTMNSNTEDGSHKDMVGMAATPVVTSKSWQVSVESLDVLDMSAMLTAILNNTAFDLIWDETSTADNQTSMAADFGRAGKAFLTDATFNFNDRENSAKSLQFSGNGALGGVQDIQDMQTIVTPDLTFTKGQFVRLFLGIDNTAVPSAVIAAARQLSLHLSLTMETVTTKDTEGDWQLQEPVGLSYDITTQALVRSDENITSGVSGQDLASIEQIYQDSMPVRWQIANVSGANQRTKGTVIVSGSCIVSQLQITAQNRQNATYQATLNGYGAYKIGA